jgi:hypothetical protein
MKIGFSVQQELLEIATKVYYATIDGVWICNQIYWTL